MIQNLPLTLNHIGVVVKDLDKAIEYCELIGLGPFESPKIEIVERELYGQRIAPGAFKNMSKFANVGSIRIELTQPLEGKSLWKDFLDTRGEGLHHLGFAVNDLEKEGAELSRKGFKLIIKSKNKNGGGSAYYSNEFSSFLIEIIQYSKLSGTT